MKKFKEAKYPIIGLATSASIYLWTWYEWSKCPQIDCSEIFIDHWLRTLELGSMFLMGFFSLFILLSQNYFKNWLKYIFSWGFPLAVYMTYITTGSSSIPAYGKVDVVRFWGIFFVGVTIIFVAMQTYLDWKKKKRK